MAYTKYPKRLRTVLVENGTSNPAGGFTLSNPTELVALRFKLYLSGTLADSDKLRVNIYADGERTALLSSSEWLPLIASIKSEDLPWLGFVGFEFKTFNLFPNVAYHPALETDIDTNALTARYVLDWPDTIYNNGNAAAVEVYGAL